MVLRGALISVGTLCIRYHLNQKITEVIFLSEFGQTHTYVMKFVISGSGALNFKQVILLETLNSGMYQ